MDQDKLRRAFGRLQAVRSNTPEGKDIDEDYVNQYNELVQILQSNPEVDLSEFLVNNAKKKQLGSIVYMDRPAHTSYSAKAYADRSYFLSKLDGLLNYLQFSIQEQEVRMGFHK